MSNQLASAPESKKIDASGQEKKPAYGDLVFETFFHKSGKEFRCIYQRGMRYVIDEQTSREWMPFPKKWYNEGVFALTSRLRDRSTVRELENDDLDHPEPGEAVRASETVETTATDTVGAQKGSNERKGFLVHPARGKIPTTNIRYKYKYTRDWLLLDLTGDGCLTGEYKRKQNVHLYYDKNAGYWAPMPLQWELHQPVIKTLVNQIQESIPAWKDRRDILSLLRACNYEPDEAIEIYLTLQKDVWMKQIKSSEDSAEQQKQLVRADVHAEKEIDKSEQESNSVPGKKAMTETTDLPPATKKVVRPTFLSDMETGSDEFKTLAETTRKAENVSLKRELTKLMEENASLKDENKTLKNKLHEHK